MIQSSRFDTNKNMNDAVKPIAMQAIELEETFSIGYL